MRCTEEQKHEWDDDYALLKFESSYVELRLIATWINDLLQNDIKWLGLGFSKSLLDAPQALSLLLLFVVWSKYLISLDKPNTPARGLYDTSGPREEGTKVKHGRHKSQLVEICG